VQHHRYSWRHQLPVVAAAGFRAVAMDCRGYGQTDKPKAVADYSLSHLIGDVVGTVYALGETQAIIVGHDWGAPLAVGVFAPLSLPASRVLT
jgi:pimeloyl-ACP methyl ester carboxylesterase